MANEVVLRPCILGVLVGTLLLAWGALIVVLPQKLVSFGTSDRHFLHAHSELTPRRLSWEDSVGLPSDVQETQVKGVETQAVKSESTYPKEARFDANDGGGLSSAESNGDAADSEMFIPADTAGVTDGGPGMVGSLPQGTYVVEGRDGQMMILKEKDFKAMAAKREAHKLTAFLFFLGSSILQLVFAYFYKQAVVDKIRVHLNQRPPSQLQDFEKDIFACFQKPDYMMYACFCGITRRAHTYYVAGLLEYWSTMFLLTVLACVPRVACCLDAFVFTYFRMKLKEKMGIKTDVFFDFLYSCFCNPCATGQEALAIDDELVAHVECFMTLKQPGENAPPQSNPINSPVEDNDVGE